MDKASKIYVSGHRGMVGAAVLRALKKEGYPHTITRSRAELDLCEASAVNSFYQEEKPDVVVIAAARVGGIHANNTYPAEFLHENLAIAHNLIHFAYTNQVKRVLFLGSSCIYPREAPQPIAEDSLLTGPLEHTNEAYAIAKITGMKLCQFYRKQYGVLFHSAMPTNLYGPGDNFHPENSHVLPALIRRFHEAKVNKASHVTLWGTGTPRREFLHVDDLAEGILHLLNIQDPPDWVNLGYGEDISIKEVAEILKDVIGFEGDLAFDPSKPDGTPRKLMDNSKMFATGWKPKLDLRAGIKNAYEDFQQSIAANTLRER